MGADGALTTVTNWSAASSSSPDEEDLEARIRLSASLEIGVCLPQVDRPCDPSVHPRVNRDWRALYDMHTDFYKRECPLTGFLAHLDRTWSSLDDDLNFSSFRIISIDIEMIDEESASVNTVFEIQSYSRGMITSEITDDLHRVVDGQWVDEYDENSVDDCT